MDQELFFTYVNKKLRTFRSVYNFNNQDDGDEMFFVIVKMLRPDTRIGCSDIKSKLENMYMSQLEYDTPKSNLQIEEWMNDIYIYG